MNLDFFENIVMYKSLTDETYLASVIDHIDPKFFKSKDELKKKTEEKP
jgi:hypothetical protein